MDTRAVQRVAIGGFGAIGQEVGAALVKGLPGLRLVAVAARNVEVAGARLAAIGASGVDLLPLAELAAVADVVIECAPAAVFAEVAVPAVERRRTLLPLSVGALLTHPGLIERAERRGARIVVPTGALLGLDAVRAAAEGTIHSVSMVTRKPPAGLAGAPYLVEHGVALDGLGEPLKVFSGSAREGARGFPANVNVAAALSLAGVGPDRTRLEIWADPTVERNVHTITVEADSARFRMTIENVPSLGNPRTGKITALSTIAALRGLSGSLRVGS